MEHILLVLHVVIATALIGVVLIQRSETDGFGLGGGSGSSFLTGRATASLLTRTTAILAALFIANSLLLSILAASSSQGSITERMELTEEGEPSVPAAIGRDEETDAAAAGLNRDDVVDTDKAAAKASKKKSAVKGTADRDDAPSVPQAQ